MTASSGKYSILEMGRFLILKKIASSPSRSTAPDPRPLASPLMARSDACMSEGLRPCSLNFAH